MRGLFYRKKHNSNNFHLIPVIKHLNYSQVCVIIKKESRSYVTRFLYNTHMMQKGNAHKRCADVMPP